MTEQDSKDISNPCIPIPTDLTDADLTDTTHMSGDRAVAWSDRFEEEVEMNPSLDDDDLLYNLRIRLRIMSIAFQEKPAKLRAALKSLSTSIIDDLRLNKITQKWTSALPKKVIDTTIVCLRSGSDKVSTPEWRETATWFDGVFSQATMLMRYRAGEPSSSGGRHVHQDCFGLRCAPFHASDGRVVSFEVR